MASKDSYNNISVVRGISPQIYLNGVNPDGQVIDTQGYESVTLVMSVGVATDAQTVTLQHSLQPAAAFGNVLAADVIADPDNTAAEILAAFLTTGTVDHAVKVLGYKGGRRYLQVDGTGGGGTGANFGVVAILGNPQYGPVDRS